MVTRMDIPISFDNTVGIVIIAMLIGLFVWMHHRRLRPEATVEAKEELSLTNGSRHPYRKPRRIC